MAILTACVSSCLFEGLTPGSFRTLAELLSWPSTSHCHKPLGSYSLVVSKLPGFPPSGGGGTISMPGPGVLYLGTDPRKHNGEGGGGRL